MAYTLSLPWHLLMSVLRGTLVSALFGLALPLACAAEPPFSLVVLPDTQFYVATNSADMTHIFRSQTDWVLSNQVARNVQFVLHEGDITEHNAVEEWNRAKSCIEVLDGQVPYALAVGNHDINDGGDFSPRDTTFFNNVFPRSAATNLPTFGGTLETNKMDNAYHLFTAGGVDWLILVLEYGPRDGALAWADQVVGAHPGHRVIVLTHTHLYFDNTLHGSKAEHQWTPFQFRDLPNDGVAVWDKFMRKHPNISLVFNGHVLGSGVGRAVMYGDYGNPVYQMLANYQFMTNGGNGFLRVVTLAPEERRMSVETYSPFVNETNADPSQTFQFDDVPFFDALPPTVPEGVVATSPRYDEVNLSWSPSIETESGVARYVVYRNGQTAGVVDGLGFADTALKEQTTNHYEVSAVDAAGTFSGPSAPVFIVTPPDLTPPSVTLVAAVGSPNSLRLVFDEPVDAADVIAVAHYRINHGVIVTSAVLGADQQIVTLSTSGLSTGDVYSLRISGIHDRAAARNLMAAATRTVFQYRHSLMADDFNDGDMVGWTVVDQATNPPPSSWQVVTGRLKDVSNHFGPESWSVRGRQGTLAYWSAPDASGWSNVAINALVRSGDDDGIGVLLRYQNASNYYKFEMDQQRRFRKLFKITNGYETTLAHTYAGYPVGKDFMLRVEGEPTELSVFLSGSNVFRAAITDTDLVSGTVGLYAWGNSDVRFDDVLVLPSDHDADVDRDRDGLLDAWEEHLIGLSPPEPPATLAGITPGDDFDHDGASNLQEFLGGTDASDPESFFPLLLQPRAADGAVTLQWPGVTNHQYVIRRAAHLPGEFLPVVEAVQGTSPENVVTVAVENADSAFFALDLDE